jgi:hypothetical protein
LNLALAGCRPTQIGDSELFIYVFHVWQGRSRVLCRLATARESPPCLTH